MNILVLGAGGPAGVNTVRALEAAGHQVWAADENPAHTAWYEDRYLVLSAPIRSEWWLASIQEIAKRYQIDYIVPQADPFVLELAQYRDVVNAATVLPATGTVMICQDKFETGWRWAKAGLRRPVHKLTDEDSLELAGAELGWPLWIRATNGAGARGATPAASTDIALAWLDYWHHRATNWEFIAEEYLPGRDYAWCGVYDHGRLVTSFARERLEYIYPNLAPSGRTGTPTIARIVHDKRVNQAAEFAVETIDHEWHGMACVDLREDVDEHPRPTEINAGRACTTVPLYHEVGLNIPALLADMTDESKANFCPECERLTHAPTCFNCGNCGCCGPDCCMAAEKYEVREPRCDPIPRDTTLHRHIDCGRVWSHAEDLVAH